MKDRANPTARMLVPVAIGLVAVLVIFVLARSGGGDESTGLVGDEAPAEINNPENDSYVVKAGDTLGGIAQKTGVPVDVLSQLNPDADPQSLAAGSRLRLR